MQKYLTAVQSEATASNPRNKQRDEKMTMSTPADEISKAKPPLTEQERNRLERELACVLHSLAMFLFRDWSVVQKFASVDLMHGDQLYVLDPTEGLPDVAEEESAKNNLEDNHNADESKRFGPKRNFSFYSAPQFLFRLFLILLRKTPIGAAY
ncbi:unnamed protein product, partial [Amoebophrya sp. A120]|eukprot:GSA120T00012788001.1